MIDLNHGSGANYGAVSHKRNVSDAINSHIDDALVESHKSEPKRNYLGGSRVGEECIRRLVFEYQHAAPDEGKEFDGKILRVFAVGHQFETLTVKWLRAAGFDLLTEKKDGSQFGFSVLDGRVRGHIDGVILDGPQLTKANITWPALWEHKAINAKSWADTVKRGLEISKPVYFAQMQLYMAYMELEAGLFTALNKDSQQLYHEAVPFDPAAAQRYSDRAVEVIRFAEANELPPRIAANSDFFICKMCPYAKRCWRVAA